MIYLEKVREYLLLLAKLDPTDVDLEEIKDLTDYFLKQQKPQVFDPYDPANILMENETSYEHVCATMEEHGVVWPKKLTEYEFYQKLAYYEKKYKSYLNHGTKPIPQFSEMD